MQPLVVLKDFLKAEDCLALALVDAGTCFTDCVTEAWTPDVDAVIVQPKGFLCRKADRPSGR